MLAPLTAACVAAAASAFGVAEPMLWTILRAEGGKVGACTPQTNGTRDCGPAQVNAETWVPHLSRVLGRPQAEVLADLRDDGCFNIHAGAYVLRVKIGEAGGDRWDGAGRYNSATPEYKRAYQLRLVKSYADLFMRGGARPALPVGAFAVAEPPPAARSAAPAAAPASGPLAAEVRGEAADPDGLVIRASAPALRPDAPPAARPPVQPESRAPALARTRVSAPPRPPADASPQAPSEPARSPAPAQAPAATPAPAPTTMAQAAPPVLIARSTAFDPKTVPMPVVPPGARPPALAPMGVERGTLLAEAGAQASATR